MSDQAVLIIAAIAAIAIVFTFFKLLGSLAKAVIIGLVAAGALYLLLPRLETQPGPVGDAARTAREVTSDLEGSVNKLKAKAGEATEQIKQGVKSAKEAADAVQKTREAVEKTSGASPPSGQQ